MDNNRVVTISGVENILELRERMILVGLRFEVRCPGMRMTAKAPKCSTIVRREYGLKGQPAKLLTLFEAYLVAKYEGDRN